MSLLQSLTLGLVQGITEFLPISSSAHLLLVPHVMGWPPQGEAFDAALHLGTIAALLAYFWRDWLELIRDGLRAPKDSMLLKLAVASVPAGLAGLFLDRWIETHLRAPAIASANLVVFGVVMAWAERAGRRDKTLPGLGWGPVLAIGFAQALALMPGVSRSGITITTALLVGLGASDAARFSFLLGTPITAAAGLMKLKDVDFASAGGAFAVAVLAAAVSGAAAIGFLIKHLQTRTLVPFAVYRVLVGAALLFFLS